MMAVHAEARMKKAPALIAIAALTFLAGAGVSHAEEGLEAAAPARWVSPEGGSRIGFLLRTFWRDVEGTTTALDAVMESATGDPLADGVVRVSVRAAALETGVARRDQKMRERHLETGAHPSIEFRTTAPPRDLVPRGLGRIEGGRSRFVEVTGDLTIRGQTRSVTARVEAERLDDGWLMKGQFTVWLSQYGIPDPSLFLNKIRDDVAIYFEIRLVAEPVASDTADPAP